MKLRTLKKLIFDKHIFGFLSLSKDMNRLYETSFATAASSCGLLRQLAVRPQTLEEIQHALATDPQRQAALVAWLGCGVKFGELSLVNGRYGIKGRLSKTLARSKNEIAAATLEEVVRYHYDAVLTAPARLRNGHRYRLADQNGELIARSVRILEPFVEEAIEWALEDRDVEKVLEVGCGGGHYLKYLKHLNPHLKVQAIDYQQDVVESAQANLRRWGLADAIDVACVDIFDFSGGDRYDLITLHNNIYYFPLEKRVRLFATLHELLAPGGRLLMTTSCRGGSPAIAALDLWWALSDVAGALPEKNDLARMLPQAGFERVEIRQMMPGESYYGVLADKSSISVRRAARTDRRGINKERVNP